MIREPGSNAQERAKRSSARTTSSLIVSLPVCPESATRASSASGQARASSQAVVNGAHVEAAMEQHAGDAGQAIGIA